MKATKNTPAAADAIWMALSSRPLPKRSRYTAYTLGREDYLLATWHYSTRPALIDPATESRSKWLGLEVKRHEGCDSN